MSATPLHPTHDPRQARTRAWILHAFNRLVLRRPYESVGVVDISRRAGVGRSTFYEHFDGKDDLLRQSLHPVLLPLAQAVGPRAREAALHTVLRHFLDNRLRVTAMLDGASRRHVEETLAELITAQLGAVPSSRAADQPALHAAAFVGMQLTIIHAWLRDPRAPVEHVARLIMDESRRLSGM